MAKHLFTSESVTEGHPDSMTFQRTAKRAHATHGQTAITTGAKHHTVFSPFQKSTVIIGLSPGPCLWAGRTKSAREKQQMFSK